MAVFDKELIVNGKAVRSPEQQVYQNMKDIEKLKQETGEWWNTQQVLTTSTTSIAISDTNAPATTQYGFLIDIVGNLFKITAGDGTNLLLEFYSALGTNSEAPIPSGDNLKLTYTADIGFSADLYALMSKKPLQEGKWGNVIITCSTSSTSNNNPASSSGTSSNSYLATQEKANALLRGIQYANYQSSNPITVNPVTYTFTDNEGNERTGIRAYQIVGTNSGNWRNLNIEFHSPYVCSDGVGGSVYANTNIKAKILVYNLTSQEYEIVDVSYTSNGTHNVGTSQSRYSRVVASIGYDRVLCGIFNISGRYVLHSTSAADSSVVFDTDEDIDWDNL